MVSYINRVYKVSKNCDDFHSEVKTIRQMLVNKNFTNTNINRVINKFLFKKHIHGDNNEKFYINIYYKKQFQNNYKIEEKTLKILYNVI